MLCLLCFLVKSQYDVISGTKDICHQANACFEKKCFDDQIQREGKEGFPDPESLDTADKIKTVTGALHGGV